MNPSRVAEAEKVLALVRSQPGISKNGVRQALNMSQSLSDSAIQVLERWGVLQVEQKPAQSKDGQVRYSLYARNGQRRPMQVPIAQTARITGAELDYVPEEPMEDKPQAAYALWHFLREQARKAEMAEQREGKDGWLWEGSMTSAAADLWPEADTWVLKSISTRLKNWLGGPGNTHCVQLPKGGSQSIWWIADKFVDSQVKPRAHNRRTSGRKRKPSTTTSPETVSEAPGAELVQLHRSETPAQRPAAPEQQPAVAVGEDEALSRRLAVHEQKYRVLESENIRLESENTRMRNLISDLEHDREVLQGQLSRAQRSSIGPDRDPRVRHLLLAVAQAAEVGKMIQEDGERS